jgi:hypothetical protein
MQRCRQSDERRAGQPGTQFVGVALALDLGVFHRQVHVVSTRGVLTSIWVSLALAFGGGALAVRGPRAAIELATGYVLE